MTWLLTSVQWEILTTVGLVALAFVVSAVGLSLWLTVRAFCRAWGVCRRAMDDPTFWT